MVAAKHSDYICVHVTYTLSLDFTPAGGAGGHRGRALCTKCLEKLLNSHPRNWSRLPNLHHQGPGEAAHDSRWVGHSLSDLDSAWRSTFQPGDVQRQPLAGD